MRVVSFLGPDHHPGDRTEVVLRQRNDQYFYTCQKHLVGHLRYASNRWEVIVLQTTLLNSAIERIERHRLCTVRVGRKNCTRKAPTKSVSGPSSRLILQGEIR